MDKGIEERKRSILTEFPDLVRSGVSLKDYCSFRVGGPADLFAAVPDKESLTKLIRFCVGLNVPYVVIGDGTNLLISDSGFRGLVIKNEISGMEVDGQRIRAGAGEEFMNLVNSASENSLTGLEFAAGIWGSVGGAIFGNAGAYGSEICDVLTEVELVDRQGNIRTERVEYFEFEYRGSKLKESGETVVSAVVELSPGDGEQIQSRVNEILAIRAQKHPRIPNSAGSFFKNILDPSQPHGKLAAGKILDDVGAKKISHGGAKVFEKHANILINSGNATAQDIRHLADILKEKALKESGIALTEEVISIGDFEGDDKK